MQSTHTISVQPSSCPMPADERASILSGTLGFGRRFTDHMITVPYRQDEGWLPGVLGPYQPLSIDPACAVLHYGQSIFEGFKAFRQVTGTIAAFRPVSNAERMQSSARRLAMPEVPTELFIQAAELLVRQDRDWVPSGRGASLYLRPVLIEMYRCLGVKPSREYLFGLLASPSGDYFGSGIKPVCVWICENYVRAAPGGTGGAKFAGNYAASLAAQVEAASRGCAQVVWLDAVHRSQVEEMGGMNIFFVYGSGKQTRLVTPKLTGTLLPGITRDSLLQLGRLLGYHVDERMVTMDEWFADARAGRMTEAFACGTAAVITPIGEIRSERGNWTMGAGQAGPVAQQLREHLLAIQYGEHEDTYGWMHPIC